MEEDGYSLDEEDYGLEDDFDFEDVATMWSV
jgi:hypothetical protein